MQPYDHTKIEEKWQKHWAEAQTYRTQFPDDREKKYILDMFPYPSGSALHVGHPKGYIATDVYARLMRMHGYNVLHPMGWDAFGLPAEQHALANKVHPREAVLENIATFKKQLQQIGFDYDWEREINTTDPAYYKWTQWIFIQLFKKGLAYQSWEPINWCPSCKTGLAQEDLEGGACERCDTPVERKPMRQWVIAITTYAERLLDDLSLLTKWPTSVIESQKNWIGKSVGAHITFTTSTGVELTPFTTRPDTLYGVTYIALAPEHPFLTEQQAHITNWEAVSQYAERAKNKTDLERQQEGKAGIRLEGVSAVHPATQEEVPIYVADYVLASYGAGVVMGVPAHDERDYAFAREMDIPVVTVIEPEATDTEAPVPYTETGILKQSGSYTGLTSSEAHEKITQAFGTPTVQYRLNDWVFSRQLYWGEPIPIVHCAACGVVPVPEDELPVVLPDVTRYEPTGTGESPLAAISQWVHTTCPSCGGEATRETNTMPQWAGSSWYYLRYMDPHNEQELVDREKEAYFSPVDVYVGGMEHATRHLIYARFWHKFLHDIGVVSTKEPFLELHNPGLIRGEDARKMSKRWGNTVSPDEMVARFGADAFRLYELFMGPFDQSIAWNTDGVVGTRRFVEKVWRLQELVSEDGGTEATTREIHRAIQKVGEDIRGFRFNTAISQLMKCANALEAEGRVSQPDWQAFLQILAPFAPHVTEELWQALGHTSSIHTSTWPAYDPDKLELDEVTIAVQVNGTVRGEVTIAKDSSEQEVRSEVFAIPEIAERLAGKTEKRFIYIPGKIVNIVTE